MMQQLLPAAIVEGKPDPALNIMVQMYKHVATQIQIQNFILHKHKQEIESMVYGAGYQGSRDLSS